MSWFKRLSKDQNFPLYMTIVVFVVIALSASIRYTGFFSTQVFFSLLSDNAFLGIAAIGMTFVILSGGIDLSVGAVISLTSLMVAYLIERSHLPPVVALAAAIATATFLGAAMGWLIQRFGLAPFLVTLAGMFFARGLAQTLSLESIQVTHPTYQTLSGWQLSIGQGTGLTLVSVLFLLTLVVAFVISRWTEFGRTTYAIGGDESSAILMGLKVKRTKVLIYALNGFLAGLAGIAYSLYTSSGNASAAVGLELDAIAAVVIGGTLLSGGAGSMIGTLIGVLILGLVQTAITFEGSLSSWWTRIVVGLLVFVFIVMQRSFVRTQALENA
jgi:galactofuranose transport system permease protein